MNKTNLLLTLCCVLLWTVSATAQTVISTTWEKSFGTISVAEVDTGDFPKELKAAVNELREQDGILLDLRKVTDEWLWSGTMWKAVKPAFDDYTKPLVILISGEIRRDYPLYHWAKPREWTRFESGGSHEEAVAKLRTLRGRHMKEGQARMDWLMQQSQGQ